MTRGRYTQPQIWISFELALVGGYCDAASFILTRTFTGHVTGNLVLAAIAGAGHDWPSLLGHLTAVVSFLVGTALSMLVLRASRAWFSSCTSVFILLIEAVLIAMASLMTTLNAISRLEVFLVLMSISLGLQNGAFLSAGGIGIHTTYMTGVITSLLTAETNATVATVRPTDRGHPRQGSTLLRRIWVFFIIGAGTGAAMALRFKSFGLLGAAGLLCLFALLELVS